VRFNYQIRRHADGALLCEGSTVHACVNKSGRVSRFPDEIVAMLHP
jgi:acyl-CoA thioesterase FadM